MPAAAWAALVARHGLAGPALPAAEMRAGAGAGGAEWRWGAGCGECAARRAALDRRRGDEQACVRVRACAGGG
jgi:hypothetical protein